MNYVAEMGSRIRAAVGRKAHQKTGTIVNGKILIEGRLLRPEWGCDQQAVDGDQVVCVVEGTKCIVFSVK